MACGAESPHMVGEGRRLLHTAGRSERPKIMHRILASSWMQGTPAGLLTPLMTGIPGIGLEMEGAVQQAPHLGRQSISGDLLL